MQKQLRTKHRCYVGRWGDFTPDRPITHDYFVIGHVHPSEFYDTLRVLLTTDIWSNNPYVVDCFPATQVVVCARGIDGKLYRKFLLEHPKYKQWKDEFESGEMWTFFGENWVVPGGKDGFVRTRQAATGAVQGARQGLPLQDAGKLDPSGGGSDSTGDSSTINTAGI